MTSLVRQSSNELGMKASFVKIYQKLCLELVAISQSAQIKQEEKWAVVKLC